MRFEKMRLLKQLTVFSFVYERNYSNMVVALGTWYRRILQRFKNIIEPSDTVKRFLTFAKIRKTDNALLKCLNSRGGGVGGFCCHFWI
jgi:hypothetical protein